jgi:hypothetical protein
MVRGYPGRHSVFAGEELALHAAADACGVRFRAAFFRWGDGWEPMGVSAEWSAQCTAAGRSTDDWNWPAYRFRIGEQWPSGVYLAMFGSETHADPCARNAALFVVKANPERSGAKILYKIPLFTYAAYDAEGGGSLYSGPGDRVTLRRPGCGAGGETFDMFCPDFYDMSSPRQTFAHWDAPFMRWVAKNGYRADYCTDLDVHEGGEWLDRYHLLLSVGHDEYWSEPMRRNVERFIARGGNVAFFGGNTCWWRVHVESSGTCIACDKDKHPGDSEPSDQWMRIDPETRLTGVSFRYGGGWWTGRRPAIGYTVRQADHWIYDGTGLRNGDVFGDGPEQALVGYECDAAPPSSDADAWGRPDFQILGLARLPAEWEYRETESPRATLGLYEDSGTVFTASTTDWARVLASGDPVVDRITRNVIDRLIIASASRHRP